MSMAESVFEAVKQSVTVREAAQMYGIEVNRSGMACCPFHDDKNPSMKLNEEYFYCFGGGATREDVALFKAHVAPHVKIKAAGGIAGLKDAEDFVALGADRLGTSRIVKAVKALEQQ